MAWALQLLLPVPRTGPAHWARGLLLVLHLGVGTLAYVGGYAWVPAGRSDLTLAVSMHRRK